MRLALPRLVVPLALLWAGIAAALPPGFVLEEVAPGAAFDVPTSIAFLPDGRLIVGEKSGLVWVVQGTAKLPTPMWDGRAEILDIGDAGLTGIAVDPHYATNRYVYFSYEVDPDSDGVDFNDVSFGRLVRYQTDLANPNVVDASTRTILIGATWSQGVPNGGRAHTIDGIRWGRDGSLLIGAGEGAYFNAADVGGQYPNLFLPGRIDPYEDIGSFRSQYVGSLAGKILRIDPATGLGYPSNPFYDGNPASNRSKVWAYGVRNPWRIGVRPGTGSPNPADGRPGTIYIGNVGWAEWEGIGISHAGGENFGWPCYENGHLRPEFQSPAPAHSGCDSLGTWGNPATSITPPIISLSHSNGDISIPPGFTGNSITGGFFYTGSLYPATYQNRYFFADYPTGQVWSAAMDATDHLQFMAQFDYDRNGPVDLAEDPFVKDLYYVAVVTNQVLHIRYTTPLPGDHVPVPVAYTGNRFGLAPLTVSFSASAIDLDGDSLALSWNFGDGQGSIVPSTSHTYTVAGTYDAVFTADDRRGGVARETLTVVVPQSFAFPTTDFLDTFDRPGGPLGAPWAGNVASLSVEDSALVESGGPAVAVIRDSVFGVHQEAYVRFNTLPQPGTLHALLLQAQDTTAVAPRLRVRLDADSSWILVETYEPLSQGWVTRGGPYPITIAAGDQLGARVYSPGVVQVFKNGALLATASTVGWPWTGSGGRVGLEMAESGTSSLDDFGGGNAIINGNMAPYVFMFTPSDGHFFAPGDTIILAGSGLDDRDDQSALHYRWDVDVHHNNHIHPDVFTSTAPTAAFVAENHDDGTGVHYQVRLSVIDSEGLKGTRSVDLWPEVDLVPGPVVTQPETVSTVTTTFYSFALQNLGAAPAPRSHWQITLDGTTVAQGDTTVPGGQAIQLSGHADPTGLAPGLHVLRVVADSADVVHEVLEGNNASERMVEVGVPTLGVDGVPRVLALSAAQPNPARGVARFQLDLPRAARVRFGMFDVAGRRVWGGVDRDYTAGRWSLDWSGTSGSARIGAGLYFARVEVEGRTLIRRVVLLR